MIIPIGTWETTPRHIDGSGIILFIDVCALALVGIRLLAHFAGRGFIAIGYAAVVETTLHIITPCFNISTRIAAVILFQTVKWEIYYEGGNLGTDVTGLLVTYIFV